MLSITKVMDIGCHYYSLLLREQRGLAKSDTVPANHSTSFLYTKGRPPARKASDTGESYYPVQKWSSYLDVSVENLSAANSRIRDADMAKELMNYTKMNVLVQSAQAMLAQANQQPQSVLQLLQ